MKSPWKRLVQFTSRKRNTEQPKETSKDKADESFPREYPLDQVSTEKSGLDVGHDPSSRLEKIVPDRAVPIPDTQHHGDAEEESTARLVLAIVGSGTADKSDQSAPSQSINENNALLPVISTAKKSSKRVGRLLFPPMDRGIPTALVHRPTIISRTEGLNDAVTLDAEIRLLRLHLSQKLHIQNEQLKKMLERFGVS